MNAFTAYTGSGARWPPLLNTLECNDHHHLREAFPPTPLLEHML